MGFNPKQEYLITEDKIRLKEFFDYRDDYITRPPYQRKSVWSVKKQQSLFDSLFRRFYVPRLVVREVRLDKDRTVKEIIDGQQRITAIQDFFDNKFRLPNSLKDIHSELPKKLFSELSTDLRKFIDQQLVINADIVKNIEDPKNPEHQKVATEIFWRLQQGETLNFMEIAHAKLSSLSRNFIVKYSDDETFDFVNYTPIDSNPHKHKFFRIIERRNERMQHLVLMTRFLLIEKADGYTDLKDINVVDFIDDYVEENGIDNLSMEEEGFAKNCLRNLSLYHSIFKDDSMIDKTSGVKELSREYLIISFYVLIRHLKKFYSIQEQEKELIKNFFFAFYERWARNDQNDLDIERFSNNRQQSTTNLQERDMILRQMFFTYLIDQKTSFQTVDTKRNFDESERIAIYRKDNGLCRECLNEGKPEKESFVTWSKYQADHVLPHSKGGQTIIENAQVLCNYHNAKKGAKLL
jgi:Protein of unknown function DUF262/HNH endonuclease